MKERLLKAQEIVDLDGAGRKLAAHGAQFGHLVDSYVNSVNTCFKHMGVSYEHYVRQLITYNLESHHCWCQ